MALYKITASSNGVKEEQATTREQMENEALEELATDTKLTNLYLSRIVGEEFTEEDLI